MIRKRLTGPFDEFDRSGSFRGCRWTGLTLLNGFCLRTASFGWLSYQLLQGGFEIRTFVALAAATEGAPAEIWYYQPIPIFAVGCTIGVMGIQ